MYMMVYFFVFIYARGDGCYVEECLREPATSWAMGRDPPWDLVMSIIM